MKQALRICLVTEMHSAHGRGAVEGIAAYGREYGPWTISFDHRDPQRTLDDYHHLGCDGIIAKITSAELGTRLRQLDVPVVSISDNPFADGLPIVSLDHYATGRLAAEHLLQRGLQSFAYLGDQGQPIDRRREAGFRETVGEAGYETLTYPRRHEEGGDNWMIRINRMARWLVELNPPAGLLACTDHLAHLVLEAARRGPVQVPDEVAVVGIDDDHLLHQLIQPALSSVRLPFDRVGYEAARLLHQLIQGAPPPAEPIRLQPIGVEARQSSEILAIPDLEVADAVRFIREHADQPIQVTDVLDAVTISRRALERRFQKNLGHSPQIEIQHAHVQRAKRLLAETNLPIPDVARRAGFTHPDRLAAAFRKDVALTPTAYRKQYRR